MRKLVTVLAVVSAFGAIALIVTELVSPGTIEHLKMWLIQR